MLSYEDLKKEMKQRLTSYRYTHTLGVVDTAEQLAKTYGVDIDKARTAALLHDCAKTMGTEELLSKARENDVKIDEVSYHQKELLHGPVGRIIARDKLGIEDSEILDAIEFHTTGRVGMTKLEKIIYIADYIEPSRNYPGVEELRNLAFQDLDKALLQSLNNTIQFVIKKNGFIHLNSIKARNDLLKNTYTNQ